MNTLTTDDPMTELIGHPVTFGYYAPHVAVTGSRCRCAAWWALVDLLVALVAFPLLEVLLIHLPTLMR